MSLVLLLHNAIGSDRSIKGAARFCCSAFPAFAAMTVQNTRCSTVNARAPSTSFFGKCLDRGESQANGTSNEEVYLLMETPRRGLLGLIVLVGGTLLSCSADPGDDSSSSEGGSAGAAGSSGAGGDSSEGGSAGAV